MHTHPQRTNRRGVRRPLGDQSATTCSHTLIQTKANNWAPLSTELLNAGWDIGRDVCGAGNSTAGLISRARDTLLLSVTRDWQPAISCCCCRSADWSGDLWECDLVWLEVRDHRKFSCESLVIKDRLMVEIYQSVLQEAIKCGLNQIWS